MNRDLYFDSLKFILVFLVVFGHMIGFFLDDSTKLIARNFIYLFHMPLFIFISGYFTSIKDIRKYKKGIVKLIETFVVFQLIALIFEVVTNKFEVESLVKPWWTLWYLFSLICWRYLILLSSKKIILLLAILTSLLIGFVPFVGYEFSLSRTLVFFPFFILGYLVNQEVIMRIRKIPKMYSILWIILLLISLVNIPYNLHKITSGALSYFVFQDLLKGFAYRAVFIGLSMITAISIINIVPENRVLAMLGKDVLGYYIYHSFLIIPMQFIIKILHGSPGFMLILIYSILLVALISLMMKVKFFNKILFNPYSYYKSKV